MAGQYSHKQFFRHIPNNQLAKYFKAKKIDLGIDFDKLEEKKVEELFKAFTALPENDQALIEAEFQEVNAMSCEGGVAALIDEAVFHKDETFTGAISDIEGFHAKSMWAFLEKQDYWRGATMFLHADNVSSSYWKKRNDLPSVAPNVEDDDIKELASEISQFFHKSEGRGRNCKVEPYRRYI